MSELTAASRLPKQAGTRGESVEIAGWLYNLRKSGKIVFPLMRDGTGSCNAWAVKANLPEETFEALKDLTQESSLIVRGQDPRRSRARRADSSWMSRARKSCSGCPEERSVPDHAERSRDRVSVRPPASVAAQPEAARHAAVRHEIIKAIRDYFDSNGFMLVDTPIFTPAACEGTTTLFEVNYFDEEKVYLTQSGQLYNEATAMAFGKTYCFGPTFRAEKSKTRRHLTEFWMVEPEMAYATLEDVKQVAEELIVFVVGRVLENRQDGVGGAGARHLEAGSGEGAVPAHEL